VGVDLVARQGRGHRVDAGRGTILVGYARDLLATCWARATRAQLVSENPPIGSSPVRLGAHHGLGLPRPWCRCWPPAGARGARARVSPWRLPNRARIWRLAGRAGGRTSLSAREPPMTGAFVSPGHPAQPSSSSWPSRAAVWAGRLFGDDLAHPRRRAPVTRAAMDEVMARLDVTGTVAWWITSNEADPSTRPSPAWAWPCCRPDVVADATRPPDAGPRSPPRPRRLVRAVATSWPAAERPLAGPDARIGGPVWPRGGRVDQ